MNAIDIKTTEYIKGKTFQLGSSVLEPIEEI